MEDSPYPPDQPDHEAPRPMARTILKRGVKPGSKPTKQKVKRMTRNSNRLLAMEKQRKAIELRKGGAPYHSIAQAVGYKDASGARKAVMRAQSDVIQESAGELVVLNTERYNHMLLALWPRVQQGDERAIQTAMGVMDRLERLNKVEGGGGTNNITINHNTGVLVVEGNEDDYIVAMKRMIGVLPDGTNAPDPQQMTAIASSPHGTDQDDIVDAEVETSMVGVPQDHEGGYVEGDSLYDHMDDDAKAAVHAVMSPPKKFAFGVDPTVKRD